MRIGIIGYGKMGKRIAEIAEAEGHEVVCKITSANSNELNSLNSESMDVAIEFTTPTIAVSNLKKLAKAGIPTVTGTTAWLEHLETVKADYSANNTSFFYASNFSIGVYMTSLLVQNMSKLMSQYPEYKGLLKEWHHTEKKDAPSGTAISLAGDVLDNHNVYDATSFEESNIQPNQLPIEAFREPNVPGTHEVIFESEIDKIQIRHEAKSRDGFAIGALRAAEFLVGQTPNTYTMNDLINIQL